MSYRRVLRCFCFLVAIAISIALGALPVFAGGKAGPTQAAARGIWRDSAFSAYASYRQVLRKGIDAYVIVGDPDPTGTGFTNRVALKLIWTF